VDTYFVNFALRTGTPETQIVLFAVKKL